jgi:murein L,D-transpeptidase YcbB/YkuD
MKAAEAARPFTPTDSIRHWLTEKKKRVIPLKNQLPIFFRYYTAAGKNGKLETYHDVYKRDDLIRKMIRQSRQ